MLAFRQHNLGLCGNPRPQNWAEGPKKGAKAPKRGLKPPHRRRLKAHKLRLQAFKQTEIMLSEG